MGVSKVVLGDETLIDLTSDSVSSENLLEGATAHGADGEEVIGGVVVTPMYTGTKAAIEAAIAAGQIPEDAIVNITDDEETSSFQSQINQLSDSLTKVKTYVDEDGKLHFVDSAGADSVLPFSPVKMEYLTHTMANNVRINLNGLARFIAISFSSTNQHVIYSDGTYCDKMFMSRNNATSLNNIDETGFTVTTSTGNSTGHIFVLY